MSGPARGLTMELVSRTHLAWTRRVARNLAPFGLNPKNAYVLRQLVARAVMSPSDIAELVYADRPTTTSLLDTLERNGWITRQRNPDNRREVQVRITPAGRSKIASVPEELWRSGKTCFDPEAGLTAIERAELVRLLTKLHRWIATAE